MYYFVFTWKRNDTEGMTLVRHYFAVHARGDYAFERIARNIEHCRAEEGEDGMQIALSIRAGSIEVDLVRAIAAHVQALG